MPVHTDVDACHCTRSGWGYHWREYYFCCHKHVFVATKVCLSRENYVCRNKTFVVTNISRDKHKPTFVATKHVFCRFETFYTYMAAPASDGADIVRESYELNRVPGICKSEFIWSWEAARLAMQYLHPVETASSGGRRKAASFGGASRLNRITDLAHFKLVREQSIGRIVARMDHTSRLFCLGFIFPPVLRTPPLPTPSHV